MVHKRERLTLGELCYNAGSVKTFCRFAGKLQYIGSLSGIGKKTAKNEAEEEDVSSVGRL